MLQEPAGRRVVEVLAGHGRDAGLVLGTVGVQAAARRRLNVDKNNVEVFSGRSAGPEERKLSGSELDVAELLSCGPRRAQGLARKPVSSKR